MSQGLMGQMTHRVKGLIELSSSKILMDLIEQNAYVKGSI